MAAYEYAQVSGQDLIVGGTRVQVENSWPGTAGPFVYGGKNYVVLVSSADRTIGVYVRAQDGNTWTELDAANHPTCIQNYGGPTDPGYDESRAMWNGMIDRRPALVVRCLGVADVVASVAFARETGIAISIKGGGHNISGLAVCDGGLLLDMSRMRGV